MKSQQPIAEIRKAENARQILGRWASNFDADRAATLHGPNAWCALNAVTQWFDHQRPTRASSDVARSDSQTFGRLWGISAAAKSKAMGMALAR